MTDSNLCKGEKHSPQGRRQSPEGNKAECPHLFKTCNVFKHTRQTMRQPRERRGEKEEKVRTLSSGQLQREERGRGGRDKEEGAGVAPVCWLAGKGFS